MNSNSPVITSKSLKLDDSSPTSPMKGSEGYLSKRLSFQTKTSKRFNRSKTIPIPEILDDHNILEPTLIGTLFSSEEKSEEQIKQIFDLIKHFSFFDVINSKFPGYSFKEPALLELCSKMKYEKHILDKTLFSQGESTNGKVYLIFSGEVSLFQKVEPISLEEEGPQRESPSPILGHSQFASSIFSEAGSPLLHRNQTKPKNHTFAPVHSPGLEILTSSAIQMESSRKAGEFVGDETLLTWEARPYTAITNGPCELLVLSRRDFHLTREKHDEKRKRVVSFLENFVPQFRANSTHKLLDELVCVMEERVMERGASLVVEGETGDKIYMMFDGTCEILKNVRVDESLNLTNTLVSVKQLLRVSPMYNDPVSVCHVSKGALVGDEIIFGSQESYNCSVRVTSGTALVFCLQKDIFISKFPKAVQNELSNLFIAKCQHYLSNLQKCLLKKYPQMDIAPALMNNAGKNSFANKIVLVPQKNAEMNLKTRVGMFRKDKNLAEESTTAGDDLPLISNRRAKSKTLVNAEISSFNHTISFQRSDSPSPTYHQMVEPSSPLNKVKPVIAGSLFEELSEGLEEEGEASEYEFLKAKISRRYINTQTFGPSREYLSSSPIKISRTLTEKGLSIRKPRLRDTDLKNSQSSIKIDLDDNLQPSPRNREMTRGKTRHNPQKVFEESPKNKGLEVLESIKEIRTSLIGKEASTKEYEMAKRRLHKSKSKPSGIKLQSEPERDLSHEKRISMLLRPYKDKLQMNGTNGLEILSNKFKPLKDGRKTVSPRKNSILPLLEDPHQFFGKGDLNSRSFEKHPQSADNLSNNWKIEVFKRKGGQTILIQEKAHPDPQTDDQQTGPVEYLIERVVVPSPKNRSQRANFETTKKLKHETNTAILKHRIKKVKRPQVSSIESFSPTKIENFYNAISYSSSSRQNLPIKLPAMPQVFIQTLGSGKLKLGSFTSRK